MALDSIKGRRRRIAEAIGERTDLTPLELFEISVEIGCTLTEVVHVVKPLPDDCAIYGLRDPGTGVIRYVGQTHRNPESRYTQHIALTRNDKERNDVKAKWISDLLAKGQKPEVVILERCDSAILNERESWWIAHYANEGANLTNGTMHLALKANRHDTD